MDRTLLEEYERWRPDLAELLDIRFFTIQWLDAQILNGAFTLFSDENSCIVASVKTYPTGAKECHIECATGELADLIGPAIRRVEQWASEQGCLVVTIQSRAGWQKIMQSQGYQPYQAAIRKDLAAISVGG